MAGLESLSPARQAQYTALLPEIERSVRNAQNARGGFYSGAAIDAEARAKADLLAKLASQDAAEQAQASESARDRELTTKIRGEEIKAGKRNALLGILGAGTGAAATLGGLSYMNKGATAGQNLVFLRNGQYGMFDPTTKSITPIPIGDAKGVGGEALAPSASAPMGGVNMLDPIEGTVRSGNMVGPPVPGTQPSIWKNMLSTQPGVGAGNLSNLGVGAAGGGLGYLGARAAGARGTGADVGAALGGLGGYGGGLALASRMGWTNPWAAGAGALFGSFGGGLLGNLFR